MTKATRVKMPAVKAALRLLLQRSAPSLSGSSWENDAAEQHKLFRSRFAAQYKRHKPGEAWRSNGVLDPANRSISLWSYTRSGVLAATLTDVISGTSGSATDWTHVAGMTFLVGALGALDLSQDLGVTLASNSVPSFVCWSPGQDPVLSAYADPGHQRRPNARVGKSRLGRRPDRG